jgi:hypothetical protein
MEKASSTEESEASSGSGFCSSNVEDFYIYSIYSLCPGE